MRKFFASGGLFAVVAILCALAGLVAENGTVFISIGAFWFIMAAITRAKYAKEQGGDGPKANG